MSEQQHIKAMADSFFAYMPNKEARAKKKAHIEADWLLVNCIDCRYPNAVHNYMLREHEDEPYDQLVLAGASLAATKAYNMRPQWEETFAEHVSLSIKMHKIFGF